MTIIFVPSNHAKVVTQPQMGCVVSRKGGVEGVEGVDPGSRRKWPSISGPAPVGEALELTEAMAHALSKLDIPRLEAAIKCAQAANLPDKAIARAEAELKQALKRQRGRKVSFMKQETGRGAAESRNRKKLPNLGGNYAAQKLRSSSLYSSSIGRMPGLHSAGGVQTCQDQSSSETSALEGTHAQGWLTQTLHKDLAGLFYGEVGTKRLSLKEAMRTTKRWQVGLAVSFTSCTLYVLSDQHPHHGAHARVRSSSAPASSYPHPLTPLVSAPPPVLREQLQQFMVADAQEFDQR